MVRRTAPSLLLGTLVAGAGLAAWLGVSMSPAPLANSAGQFLSHLASTTIRAGSAQVTVTSVSHSPVALQDDRSIGTGVVQFSTDSVRMVRIDHGHEIMSGSGTVPEVFTSHYDVVAGLIYLAIGPSTVGSKSVQWVSFPKAFRIDSPVEALASAAGFSWPGPPATETVRALGPARLGRIETARYLVTDLSECGTAASALPKTLVWVDRLGRLVQLRQVRSFSGRLATTTVTTVRLRNFGVPVNISPPASSRGTKQGTASVSVSNFGVGACHSGAWVAVGSG